MSKVPVCVLDLPRAVSVPESRRRSIPASASFSLNRQKWPRMFSSLGGHAVGSRLVPVPPLVDGSPKNTAFRSTSTAATAAER